MKTIALFVYRHFNDIAEELQSSTDYPEGDVPILKRLFSGKSFTPDALPVVENL